MSMWHHELLKNLLKKKKKEKHKQQQQTPQPAYNKENQKAGIGRKHKIPRYFKKFRSINNLETKTLE